MIEIKIDKGRIEAKGHAKDKYVCNTISTLLWALSMSLENANAKCLEISEGHGWQVVGCKLDPNTYLIFEGIVGCLRTLQEQFPKEINIVFGTG